MRRYHAIIDDEYYPYKDHIYRGIGEIYRCEPNTHEWASVWRKRPM